MVADLALVIAVVSAAAAVYAAVQGRRANDTAERALGWQQERDQPKVRIEFQHGTRTHAAVINPNNPKPAARYYELTVRVVNDGSAGEQLSGLTLETANRERSMNLLEKTHEEPMVEPHTAYRVGVNIGNLPDRGSGYVAVARLARGRHIVSGVEQLQRDRLRSVVEHNESAGYGRGDRSNFGPID
jgi:hypothetical protein